jgi:hypothetical protein
MVKAYYVTNEGVGCSSFFNSFAYAAEWKRLTDHCSPGFITTWVVVRDYWAA